MLSRLPQELRDLIYELTVGSPEEEVDVFSPCTITPRSILLLVSQSLNTEVTTAIQHRKGWPCKHDHFSLTMSSEHDLGQRFNKGHDFDNILQLRIVSTKPRSDILTVVTLTFTREHSRPDIDIHDAIRRRKLGIRSMLSMRVLLASRESRQRGLNKSEERENVVDAVRWALHWTSF